MTYLEMIIGGVIAQAYSYMERTGRMDSFERFPYLHVLSERLKAGHGRETEPSAREGAGCCEWAERGMEQEEYERTEERYKRILNRLSGGADDPVLETAVGLAVTTALVEEFAAYLHYYTGRRATIQLAFEMCGVFCPGYAEVTEKCKALGQILYVEKKNPLNYADMEAGHELFSYLAGCEPPEKTGVERFFCENALQPMYVRDTLAGQGAELLAQDGIILHVCGRGGRRFLVKHIAKRMKRDALIVQSSLFFGDGHEDQDEKLMRMIHEAFLYSCIVCIYEEVQKKEKDGKEETAACLLRAARLCSEKGIPVIICTESAEKGMEGTAGAGGKQGADASAVGAPDRWRVVFMELTPLSREERKQVWHGLVKEDEWNEDIERCSTLCKMNAGEIARAVEQWRNRCGISQCEREESLSEICCRILCGNQRQPLGTVLIPRVGIADLIVPEQVKRTLQEICCGALMGYRIYEEWGLEKQYPYGKNISLLLAGPPGTGKTMTAHVLAHEIGMPLYQVDLSRMIDKYIGETEKHLDQVFAFAEKGNVVLFFDEADALFGKRGEVTEGRDRYANMEVSYLLQRIEQYDGIVILATNFYRHIDKAFLRRMKYVLKYQEPDGELRRKIWESCLAQTIPREKIDLPYLAEQFAFSGGVIKNVIQSACISAVYEERPLCMEHVLRAVRMEYEKLERSISPQMWGEYGYLMDESLR